ncbi:hypothetical protein ASZ78_009519 [Callipepla squamata]|uniref:Claudin n=1 Tax=Callipepla squamata TaxID=9009 RepID=A0A226MNH0_CALSU|nr:hypothetical protein ASZ78_009519 [Callipepla squamata]
MVATCLHLAGFVCSFIGWIGVVVATATNDWVVTCGYTITTCRKMDELGSKGLWADCVMATGLYHCKPLVDILILPGYVQACRALMIAASVLGLPAIFLLITVLPCIRMGHEPGAAKYRRSQLGGILIILLGCVKQRLLCSLLLVLPHLSHLSHPHTTPALAMGNPWDRCGDGILSILQRKHKLQEANSKLHAPNSVCVCLVGTRKDGRSVPWASWSHT